MLPDVEQTRLGLSKATDPKKKSQLGQFFTPAKVARFMAGLFVGSPHSACRLLDAGAGIGSLAAAFLDRWISGDFDFRLIKVDAFEIDAGLHPYLTRTLQQYQSYPGFVSSIRSVAIC